MPILFQEFLKPKLNLVKPKGGTYWGAFSNIVDLYDASPPDWVTTKEMKEIRQIRQLDKFEPAITYYLFSALAEATDSFEDSTLITSLLRHAFPPVIAEQLGREVARCHSASLEFEAQIAPNKELREAVKVRVAACPVAYIRRVAAERMRVRFESATRLDCFIGDKGALGKDPSRAAGKFGLGTEAKFTADVDDEATYSPHRNQIARIIEVGNQRCERFVFLLITPRAYRLANSRLYCYRMEEYKGPSGIAALRRDILLPQSDVVLARWIRDIGWLDWEHVVEFLYPEGQPRPGWNSVYTGPLREFLQDRCLWPFS